MCSFISHIYYKHIVVLIRELLDYLSTPKSQRPDDIDISQLVALLKQKDTEMQDTLKIGKIFVTLFDITEVFKFLTVLCFYLFSSCVKSKSVTIDTELKMLLTINQLFLPVMNSCSIEFKYSALSVFTFYWVLFCFSSRTGRTAEKDGHFERWSP